MLRGESDSTEMMRENRRFVIERLNHAVEQVIAEEGERHVHAIQDSVHRILFGYSGRNACMCSCQNLGSVWV